MIAYLDTQAFDHIYKKIGCTSADVANLRKAIYGRQLSIRLSVHTLEEILLARKVSPQALAAQIKQTLSLASSRTLVKPCAQLLFDDIRAYANRGEADRPFLGGDAQNVIADGIAALIETDAEDLDEDFVAVLDKARQEKQHFSALLDQARQMAYGAASQPPGWASFDDYFEAAALTALEPLTEQAGVARQCRERGLNGLLEIRSVRMSIAAALALNVEPVPAPLHSGAFHHSASAAAVAETYVTGADGVRDWLKQMPRKELIVNSLGEFLKRL